MTVTSSAPQASGISGVPLMPRPHLDEAVQALSRARSTVLACHVNPDGDCLGSMLALGLALRARGQQVTLLSADPVPASLSFLPGAETIAQFTDRADFDLAVVLDAGDLSRVGHHRGKIESVPLLIDIDHHVTGGVFGQIRLLDATAAATAEIVYDLLLQLDAPVTRDIAQCLLCGLLTDTGSFRFPNTTPRTLQIAGEMLRLGASTSEIAENVFENKPFAAQKLLGRALDSLSRTQDGRIVWASVTQEDFIALGVGDELTEGIVSFVRSVQGADVAFLLREMPSGKWRISLRTRDPWNVSLVAARFGGGGHRLASGCSLDGSLENAVQQLVQASQQMMHDIAPVV